MTCYPCDYLPLSDTAILVANGKQLCKQEAAIVKTMVKQGGRVGEDRNCECHRRAEAERVRTLGMSWIRGTSCAWR
jgi:hypothetical protein